MSPVVGDVVAGVGHRRGVPGAEPDRVHAEVRAGTAGCADAGQVADPVAVAVGEAARVDLVDDGGPPPVRRVPEDAVGSGHAVSPYGAGGQAAEEVSLEQGTARSSGRSDGQPGEHQRLGDPAGGGERQPAEGDVDRLPLRVLQHQQRPQEVLPGRRPR